MTINEIIYDVRESVRQYHDDTDISDRYILHLFKLKRAKYLRQDLNNFQKVADISVMQTLCLETEIVSASECGLDIECETILRTKQPLPKLLELTLKTSIISIKPNNLTSIPFNFITKEKAAFFNNAPFKNNISVFLNTDNHLYFVSNNDAVKLLDCVTVTAIFEDPLELENYTNCCGCDPVEKPCVEWLTTDYPIQVHYVDPIREEVVQLLIRSIQIPQDKSNNATDDVTNNITKPS